MIKVNLQLLAHKMGMGSTRNGRDSRSKRLGAKLADGQFCTAGSIIYRQRGTPILSLAQRRLTLDCAINRPRQCGRRIMIRQTDVKCQMLILKPISNDS